MAYVFTQGEPASAQSSNKPATLGERVQQTLSRLRAFCLAPPDVQLDMTYPPVSEEVVQRFIRAQASLEHAKNNPTGKFAHTFVSIAGEIDTVTKKGLCEGKALKGDALHKIREAYDAIPKTEEGVVPRLDAIFQANAQCSAAGRCLELYFNAEARYHWKHLEPSGFAGLKQALTGRAPT